MGVNKFVAAGVVLGLAASTAWAQLTLRPGQYDVKLELSLPGVPISNAQQDTDCLSADDAKDLVKAMLRELAAETTCTASNVKTAGKTLTFDAACTLEGNSVTAKTELVVQSDTAYVANMLLNAAGVSTQLKITGRWASATCTA
jgi:hypothetical protein